jgi:multicomponent Na+:H+ antiporter subunit D
MMAFFAVFLAILPSLLGFAYKFSNKRLVKLSKISSLGVISLVAFLGWVKLLNFTLFKPFYINITTSFYTFNFGLDIYGLGFVCLVASLWLPASIYAYSYMEENYPKADLSYFFAFFHLTVALALLFGFCQDLIGFFTVYELITLSTIPLISFVHTPDTAKNVRIYLYNLLGASIILLLPMIIYIFANTSVHNFEPNGFILSSYNGYLSASVILIFMVFGVCKNAIFPFHSWLPAAMIAPTPVSALLHSVAVVNVGLFASFRIINNIIGLDSLVQSDTHIGFLQVLNIFAGFTVVFASLAAILSGNLKKRLAYSTIAQLSYSLLAFFCFSINGLVAGLIQMVCHSLAKIILFFCAGYIYTSTHKKHTNELNGLGLQMPLVFIAFTFASLSLIGLPLTAGFVGKWIVIESLHLSENSIALIVLIFASASTAIYTAPIIYRAFFMRGVRLKLKQYPQMLLAIYMVLGLNIGVFAFYKKWTQDVRVPSLGELDLGDQNLDQETSEVSDESVETD